MNARPILALASAAMLAACAGPAMRVDALDVVDRAQARCLALFDDVDAAVDRAGVRDAQETRIEGFPHLRVDRLLASFRFDADGDDALRFWIARLGELDANARRVELANLPRPERVVLERTHGRGDDSLTGVLDRCRARFAAADAADPERAAALRQAAVVPDDYRTEFRVFGLYYLTRLPFAAGVRAFERKVAQVFATPLDALPVRGRLARLAPPPAPREPQREMLARLVRDAADNPLRIAYPDGDALRTLAQAHAPQFELDVVDDNDLIGAPYWPPSGPARIDTTRPVVYYRAAHTRAGDEVLLQLVYTAWFPARPASGPFDLLAGHLDGLVWRVTLAPDGEPLVYDSIHLCGCYHFFFPTLRAQPRPPPDRLSEWLFVPQTLLASDDVERAVLRVAMRTHYLQHIRLDTRIEPAAARYVLLPADGLRSLPHPDGARRSLYGPDGFVAGTERLERFVFWPMGVENAGAMRQWGRHATAFVGRRHFDDPYLLETRFALELRAPAEYLP